MKNIQRKSLHSIKLIKTPSQLDIRIENQINKKKEQHSYAQEIVEQIQDKFDDFNKRRAIVNNTYLHIYETERTSQLQVMKQINKSSKHLSLLPKSTSYRINIIQILLILMIIMMWSQILQNQKLI